LKTYGPIAKFKSASAESRIIFYYGVRSIRARGPSSKANLEYFGFPVVERIEQGPNRAANDYFRTKLHDLLETA
jgi:hypothetical protein